MIEFENISLRKLNEPKNWNSTLKGLWTPLCWSSFIMFFVSVRVFCSNSNKIIEWFQKTYVFLLSHFVLCILSVAIILIASYGNVEVRTIVWLWSFEFVPQSCLFMNHLMSKWLEPVSCKKRQKVVPDQLLVWGIRALWRFWMVPNWS